MEKLLKLKLWLIKNLPFTTIVVEGVRYYLLSKEHELTTVKGEVNCFGTSYNYKKFYRFWNAISEFGEKEVIYIHHGYARVCGWGIDCKEDQYLEAEISNSKKLEIFKIKEKINLIYGHISDLKKKLVKTQVFTSSEIKEIEGEIVINKKNVELLEKEIKNIGGNDRWPWGY